MKVTEQDVIYVADLANLELTEAERGRMVVDMNSILEYVERLSQIDTTGVEPMAQTSDRYGADPSAPPSERFAYALRDDVAGQMQNGLAHDRALANAPATDGQYFKVPKVIER